MDNLRPGTSAESSRSGESDNRLWFSNALSNYDDSSFDSHHRALSTTDRMEIFLRTLSKIYYAIKDVDLTRLKYFEKLLKKIHALETQLTIFHECYHLSIFSKKSTNLVLHCCKHGCESALEHVLVRDVFVLQCLSQIQPIKPEDLDRSGYNCFYYAIRNGKPNMLITLLNWIKSYKPEKIENFLSKAMAELKERNVPIAEDVEATALSEIARCRYFAGAKLILFNDDVTSRIKMVCKYCECIVHFVDTEVEIDRQFIGTIKFVAQNLDTLSKSSSIESIPLMVFIFSSFASAYTDHSKRILHFKYYLTRLRIRKYAESFINVFTDLYPIPDDLQLVYRKLRDIDCLIKTRIIHKANLGHDLKRKLQGVQDNEEQVIQFYLDQGGKEEIVTLQRVLFDWSSSPSDPNITQRIFQLICSYTKQMSSELQAAVLYFVGNRENLFEAVLGIRESPTNFKRLHEFVNGVEYKLEIEVATDLSRRLRTVSDARAARSIASAYRSIPPSDYNSWFSNLERLVELVGELEDTVNQLKFVDKTIFDNVYVLLENESKKYSADFDLSRFRKFIRKVDEYKITNVQYIRGYARTIEIPEPFYNLDMICQRLYETVNASIEKIPEHSHRIQQIFNQIGFYVCLYSGKCYLANRWIGSRYTKTEDICLTPNKTDGLFYSRPMYDRAIASLRIQLEKVGLTASKTPITYEVYKTNKGLQLTIEHLLYNAVVTYRELHEQSENTNIWCEWKMMEHGDLDMWTLCLAINIVEKEPNFKIIRKKADIAAVESDFLRFMNVLTCLSTRHLLSGFYDKQDAKKINLLVDLRSRCLDGYGVLHYAAVKSDRSCVAYFVRKKAPQNEINSRGIYPIHVAAFNDNTAVLDLMSAEYEALDAVGNTPLHAAVLNGSVSSVMYLSEWVPISKCNYFGDTSVDCSIIKNRLRIFAHLTTTDDEECEIRYLHAAVDYNSIEIVEYLCKCNVDVDARVDNKTALHRACLMGFDAIAQMLLNYEATAEASDSLGNTALHYAAGTGLVDVVAILLQNMKADVVNDDLETPLHFAARCDDGDDIFDLLHREGATLNAVSRSGKTALHMSTKTGNRDVSKSLIKAGAAVNIQDADGRTPLHYAVLSNLKGIVPFLLYRGANVDIKDNYGWSPLHLAIINNNETIELLLNRSVADPNERVNGRTLLHLAVEKSRSDIIEYYKKRNDASATEQTEIIKINFNAITENKESCLHLACRYGNMEIVNLLLPLTNINLLDRYGRTALHEAARAGDDQIIKLLLEAGAKANLDSETGTPFYIYVCSNNGFEKRVADRFLRVGIQVYSMGKHKETPFMSAVIINKSTLVDYIISKRKPTPKHLRDAIFRCIELDNATTLSVLLHSCQDKQTVADAFHECLLHGSVRILRILVDAGCDVNGPSNPLYLCVRNNRLFQARFLISRGADTNETVEVPLLHAAVALSYTDMVQVLVDHPSTNIDCRHDNLTSLMRAVYIGNIKTAKVLLNAEANIEACNSHGTALHLAAGHLDITSMLCSRGASKTYNQYGQLPVHRAVEIGSLKVVQYYSKQSGAYPCDKFGRSLVVYSVLCHQPDILWYLVENGADVNESDNDGKTPLCYCVQLGFESMFHHLIELRAYYNGFTTSSVMKWEDFIESELQNPYITKKLLEITAYTDQLFEGIRDDKIEVVTGALLRAKGNAFNCQNQTPLQLACELGRVDIVHTLLKFQVNPNISNDTGDNPLHFAVRSSNLSIVKQLLSAGAIYNETNFYDLRPIDLASDNEIKSLLTFVNDIFKEVKSSTETTVTNKLLATTDTDVISAVLNCIDLNRSNVIAIAIQNNHPNVRKLRNILQEDVAEMMTMLDEHIINKQYQEALILAKKVYENRRQMFSKDNPIILEIRRVLGFIYRKINQYKSSLRIFEDILHITNVAYGHDHPYTLETYDQIVNTMAECGLYYEALDVYKKGTLGTLFKVRTSKMIESYSNIAEILELLGRYDESLEYLNEVLIYNDTKYEGKHSAILDTNIKIASVLSKAKRYAESLTILKELWQCTNDEYITTIAIAIEHVLNLLPETEHKLQTFIKTYNFMFKKVDAYYPTIVQLRRYLIKVMFYHIFNELNSDKINKLLDRVIYNHQVLQSIPNKLTVDHIESLTDKLYPIMQREIESVHLEERMRNQRLEDPLELNLFHAILQNDAKTVAKLFKFGGINILALSPAGNTALHLSILCENARFTKQVLDFAQDKVQQLLDAKRPNGATALHIAAQQDSYNLAQILLINGAIFEATDDAGQTPLQIGGPKVTELLAKIGRLFDLPDTLHEMSDDFAVAICARNHTGRNLLQVYRAKNAALANELEAMIVEKRNDLRLDNVSNN